MQLDIYDEYRAVCVLGEGGEGTVHLIENKQSGERFVYKEYFDPIVGSSGDGLRRYAEQVPTNPYGLPQITLYDSDNIIRAVQYPHVLLRRVHHRVFGRNEKLKQALFGAYCQMQAYLIEQAELALLDTDAVNFLLDEMGQFHFIDFGFNVKRINHPHLLDQGRLGYGFAMMLLSVNQHNLKTELMPSSGYAYNEPCRYNQCSMLSQLANEKNWVKNIVKEVTSRPASCFLNADFYRQIGSSLPIQFKLKGYLSAFNALLIARSA